MAIDNEDFHKPSVVIRFADYLTIDPVKRGATYLGTSEECRRYIRRRNGAVVRALVTRGLQVKPKLNTDDIFSGK